MIKEITGMEIGDWIKEKRRAAGLRQYELAKMIPVNKNTMSRYETGEKVPTWDIVEKIVEILGAEIVIREKADESRIN